MVALMKSSASTIARLATRYAARTTLALPRMMLRAPPLGCVRELRLVSTTSSELESSSSASSKSVPPEDYYEGHLMADHLEFLNDMLEKTTALEQSLEDLHRKHKVALMEVQQQRQESTTSSSGVKWMDSTEIDALLEPTKEPTVALQEQLAEWKKLVASARQAYAVDAPDGRSDGQLREEMAEIRHIIDDAAVLEDATQIHYQHQMEEKIRKDRARDPEHDW